MPILKILRPLQNGPYRLLSILKDMLVSEGDFRGKFEKSLNVFKLHFIKSHDARHCLNCFKLCIFA